MDQFVHPRALMERTITPDLLYKVGIMLQPDQERELLSKLRFVLVRRVGRAILALLDPMQQRELEVLGQYAPGDAVERWLADHVPDLPSVTRVECLLLQAALFSRAAEIQASKGQRGIPDWSDYWAENGEAA